jgi:hypothetical protein
MKGKTFAHVNKLSPIAEDKHHPNYANHSLFSCSTTFFNHNLLALTNSKSPHSFRGIVNFTAQAPIFSYRDCRLLTLMRILMGV